ncbi:MAG: glycosyltransferase family 2 protein [Bacteroidia bacterium]|nr:MAG: glycosyltransferase family 2 protein [Bacteroidia bacterium]
MNIYYPLVSVIITNYNHANWVAERIESVLNQTYKNLEIFIFDDASTDNSKEVLHRYVNHPKVKKIIFNETNSGSPFQQWRKAFQMVNGDLIWIAESDDYNHPEFLSSLIPAFENADCVLAHSELIFVDPLGNPISEIITKTSTWYSGEEFLKQKMVLFDSLCNTGQVVFRKNALNNISEAYLDNKLSGDYRLFCEIIIQGKVFASGLPHAFFRKHEAELTTKYVGTIVYHQEHFVVLDWLIKKGIANPKVIRRIAYHELVQLYCIHKGMPKEEATALFTLFRNACKKHNQPIPSFRAKLKSYMIKGAHYYRTKLRNG